MNKTSKEKVLLKEKRKKEFSSWKLILIPKRSKKEVKYRFSLIYAILINTTILIGIILTISILTLIGGFWINPALIFGIMIIVVLFSILEGLNLIQKEIDSKKDERCEKFD
jgi:hypothetical protein